jgi:uncharacterized protein (TIGR02246 family)
MLRLIRLRSCTSTLALALAATGALGLGAARLGLAAGTAPARADLKTEFQRRLDQDSAAWTRGDLEAFCAGYADDATFISPSGVTQGRAQVLERYKKRYLSQEAMGRLELQVLEARTADPPDALRAVSIAARWTLRFPDQAEVAGYTLLVYHRDAAGTWKIVQDASM